MRYEIQAWRFLILLYSMLFIKKKNQLKIRFQLSTETVSDIALCNQMRSANK